MLQFDKHGSIPAASSGLYTAQAYEGDPTSGQCSYHKCGKGESGPAQMPYSKPGLRSSGHRSPTVRLNVAGTSKHNVAPQAIVAAARQPTVAAQQTPAGGMLESQHAEKEVHHILLKEFLLDSNIGGSFIAWKC